MSKDFSQISVGVLGNGAVGQSISKLCHFRKLTVMMGGRTTVPDFPKDIAQTSLDGAAQADLVVLALPFESDGRRIAAEVVRTLSETLAGKAVVDATNPLGPNWSPLNIPGGRSGAETIQEAAPTAHVVKALNTVFADNMSPERLGRSPVRPAGFFCGNASDDKVTVSWLLSYLGFAPVDAGGLQNARYLESLAHLNIQLAIGGGRGTSTAFAVVDLA